MCCLSLMVLSLAVLLSAANSSPPVDQLENLVSEILNRYRPTYKIGDDKKGPMFSLAVSIPFNQKTNKFDISQVHDDVNDVKKTMLSCDVFIGNKVVAATVLRWPDVVSQCPHGLVQWRLSRDLKSEKTWADVFKKNPSAFQDGTADHAEYRTLQKLNEMRNHNQDDLLLIYVFASPCARRCANTNNKANILDLLKEYKKKKNFIFVFSKVFKPHNSESVPDEQLREALEKMGAVIGLKRIFRCDKLNGQMCCMSCDVKGNVAQWCYIDNQHDCYNVGGRG